MHGGMEQAMHTVSSAELWSFLVEEKDDSLAHYSVFPFRSSRVQKHMKLFISIVIFSTGSVVAQGGVLDLVPDWVVPYGDVSYVPAKTPELNWWELEVHHRPLVWNKCKTLVLFTLSPFILFYFFLSNYLLLNVALWNQVLFLLHLILQSNC